MKKIRLFSLVFAIIYILGSMQWGAVLQAATKTTTINPVLYETKSTQQLSNGATYEKKSKFTKDGWVDIYALTMDRTNPYLQLDILRSNTGFGVKDTLSNLGKTSPTLLGAVNGSFFNMKTNPTEIIGNEYENGTYSVLAHNYNTSENGGASLIVTPDGMLTTYLGVQIKLTTEFTNEMYVQSVNKFDNLANTFIVTSLAMTTTSAIDLKAKGYKIVVENAYVKEIVPPSVPAVIPANGYIIWIPEAMSQFHLKNFPVGTGVDLEVKSATDVYSIQLALTGGGKILNNGVAVSEGLLVDPTRRQPRTAVGISQDQKKLVFLVVDGRGQSIGATQAELATYLKEYGAYNAMNLDGGGSSEMITKDLSKNSLKIVNTPSEGEERKIANGIGVISTAPIGTLKTLVITPGATRAYINTGFTFSAYGLDENMNVLPVDVNGITWSTQGGTGTWNKNVFFPTTAGDIKITAYYQGISTSSTIKVVDSIIDIEVQPKILTLYPGDSGSFKVIGTDKDGYKGVLNSGAVAWKLDNPAIGVIVNNVFTADSVDGITKLTATVNGRNLTAYVVVGGLQKPTLNFESFLTGSTNYPDIATGSAIVTNEQTTDAGNSIKVNYTFQSTDATQAVYATFSGMKYTKKITQFGIWVYGDGLNNMAKARVTDASGKTQNITICPQIDFIGWKYFNVQIPSDLSYPIEVDRLYVASLGTLATYSSSIFFDQPQVVESFDTTNLKFDAETLIADPLLTSAPDTTANKLSIFGPTAGRTRLIEEAVLAKAYEKMAGANQILYAGNSQIDVLKAGKQAVTWANKFAITDQTGYRLIQLGTDNGSMRTTDYTQWTKLNDALKNTVQQNIIIVGNKNAFTGFADAREGKILQETLSAFQKKTGKNIFYINASGNQFNLELVEGVRYLDLNGVKTAVTPDKKVNLSETYYIVDFYTKGNNLSYVVRSVFPKVEL